MMRNWTVMFVLVVLASAQNPASFVCDEHNQTFIRNGTITRNGRCYEQYSHSLPVHRVLLPCQTHATR